MGCMSLLCRGGCEGTSEDGVGGAAAVVLDVWGRSCAKAGFGAPRWRVGIGECTRGQVHVAVGGMDTHGTAGGVPRPDDEQVKRLHREGVGEVGARIADGAVIAEQRGTMCVDGRVVGPHGKTSQHYASRANGENLIRGR